MAAVTAPTGRSLLGKLALALQARSRRATGRPSKLAAAITEHIGTMTALGFADAACWHWGSGAGLIGTAVVVLVADFKVRGLANAVAHRAGAGAAERG